MATSKFKKLSLKQGRFHLGDEAWEVEFGTLCPTIVCTCLFMNSVTISWTPSLCWALCWEGSGEGDRWFLPFWKLAVSWGMWWEWVKKTRRLTGTCSIVCDCASVSTSLSPQEGGECRNTKQLWEHPVAMWQKVSYRGSKPGWWLREEPANGGDYSRHRTLAMRPEEIVLGRQRPEIYSPGGRCWWRVLPRAVSD